jgi:hypothetical protein
MTKYLIGQKLKIPCEVSPGPFSDEWLVTFDTIYGRVSGFVSADDLVDVEDDKGFLRCEIVRTTPEGVIIVRVNGSFFTTNGLAYLDKEHQLAA